MTFARFRAAGLLWPTGLALVALAILVSLGTWQLQRKGWKDGLIRQIQQRAKADPVPLHPHLQLGPGGISSLEYLRVRTSGRYLHEHERHLYMPGRQGPGWHIYTPLETEQGLVIMVNRGWVPDRMKDAATRQQGQVGGRQEITGLLRAPEQPGLFTPDNDPAKNIWFWRDLAGMLGCKGDDGSLADCRIGPNRAVPVPLPLPEPLPARFQVFLDADASPTNPGGWPQGGATNLSIPNRHLEYALTWYGLALTLIGVYAAFAASRLRGPALAAPPA